MKLQDVVGMRVWALTGAMALLATGAGRALRVAPPEPESLISAKATARLYSSEHPRARGVIATPPCQRFEALFVLARFRPEVSQAEIDSILQSFQLRNATRLSPLGFYLLEIGPQGAPEEDDAATLALLEGVLQFPQVSGATLECRGQGGVIAGVRGVPSDTWFPEQWHLNSATGVDIDAPEAWAITTGSNQVVVGVVDSGSDLSHPEIVGRIFESAEDPINGVDDDGDGWQDDQNGWDFVGADLEPNDEHSHGTWVSGVFGADTDNGFGVSGVDHEARIAPLKILDQTNSGFTSSLVSALDYALLHPEIKVVNLSLVNFPVDAFIGASLDALATQAILLACAGNSGPGTADSQYPGAHPATISVASTTSKDAISASSSSGATVDLSAPGKDIVTVRAFSPADDRIELSGCSFATPMVAGGASLTLAIRPETDASDFRLLLRHSVKDLGPAGWDEDFGWGRLDLDDLLREALVLVFQDGFEGGGVGKWEP